MHIRIHLVALVVLALEGCASTPPNTELIVKDPTYLGPTRTIMFADSINNNRRFQYDLESRTLLVSDLAQREMGQFAVSPDGGHLAFASNRFDSNPKGVDICLFDLVTKEVQTVSTAGLNRFPFWSGDGKYLFYSSYTDNSFLTGKVTFEKYDVSLGKVVDEFGPFAAATMCSANEDGTRIIFDGAQTMSTTGYYDVSLMLLDTRTRLARPILRLNRTLTIPAKISKSGEVVYFLGTLTGSKKKGLHQLSLVSGETTLLVPIPQWDTTTFNMSGDQRRFLITYINRISEIDIYDGSTTEHVILNDDSNRK